jgi:Ca2+-binding RTX toxin-like protein/cyclophilin family peptidyl-prolyl cis-trans isomerase
MKKFSWLDGFHGGFKRNRTRRQRRRVGRRARRDIGHPESLEPRIVLAAPTLVPISDVAFRSGSPVHIPLNGVDSDGDPLTFSVTSNNAALLTEIPDGNRSLRITVQQGDAMSPTISGEMTFELFEDEASRATNRVITLAESGFYDGALFHRVVDNFVIQGGDPNGNPPGTGGSSLGDFDDQFDVDLQHNQTGMLSFAKSTDDTNDSQFFITEFIPGTSSETNLRNLDSNHSVFGAQTTGEAVRAAISDTAVSSSTPTVDVVMTSVEVFVDNENGLLRINAPEGTTGSGMVTVTVSDGNETAQQSFNVTFVPDGHNNDPFLADIPSIRTLVDTPTSFQLAAIDAESVNSAFLDEDELSSRNLFVPKTADPAEVSYDIGFLTGAVVVTPASSFTGATEITVSTAEFSDAIDYHVVSIDVVAAAAPLTVTAADHPGQTEANDGNADEIRVVRNGTVLEVSVNGRQTAQAEFVSVTTLTIDGSRDDDTLIVDYSGGNPFPSGGIVFSGYTVDPDEVNPPADTGTDSLEFTGGTIEEMIYSFVNANDGSVNLDARLLAYTGLEPIVDNLSVTDRIFAFSSADDVITVSDDGNPANGLSRISSSGTSETVDFSTPLGSLTIFGGAGNDTINVGDLESGAFPTTVDGGSGNDAITGSAAGDLLRGGSGNDTLSGGAGADTLSGEDDNDLLNGDDGADVINGGTGNDSIHAGAGADRVFAGGGNDQVDGGAGDDLLFGDGGSDTISGADGLDLIRGGSGADELFGDSDNDTLFGEQGFDTVSGGDGDDVASGGTEDDVVSGESGDDTLNGENGRDSLLGGAGDDVLSGGSGFDTLSGEEGNDTLSGGTGNDTLSGGDNDDLINGDSGADVVFAGADNDVVNGGDGADRIFGNDGNDTINGGNDNDQLFGDAGQDRLEGADGDDLLRGGGGADAVLGEGGGDTLFGDQGFDTIVGADGNDLIDGGTQDDRVFGDDGADTITGGDGRDFLRGGVGNDLMSGDGGFDTLFGDLGNDTISGGTGNDAVFAGSGLDSVSGGDGNDRIFGDNGFDTISGGLGDDFVRGGLGFDVISGDEGNDQLFGDLHNDTLTGGIGLDTIGGNEGLDVVFAGADNDVVDGGAGDDQLFGDGGLDTISGGDGNDFLRGGADADLLNGDAGLDTLFGDQGNDSITGGGDADLINGDAGNDTLEGGDGADTLRGGANDDSLDGGAGNDGLSGAGGNDFLLGNSDDDTIYGGSGDDALLGSGGNDTVVGGGGSDTVRGNGGTDVLVGGSGTGAADAGDNFPDAVAGEIDENFMQMPLPGWVEEV